MFAAKETGIALAADILRRRNGRIEPVERVSIQPKGRSYSRTLFERGAGQGRTGACNALDCELPHDTHTGTVENHMLTHAPPPPTHTHTHTGTDENHMMTHAPPPPHTHTHRHR